MSAGSTIGWRERVLASFTPEIAAVARLTVVADADDLLTEAGVVTTLRDRGFEIVPFDDHVLFRYAYERRFRQVWDTGAATNLVVVLRASRPDVDALPYDLVSAARRESRLLAFSLAEVFPRLAPHVVGELDRSDLDVLFAAHEGHAREPLGENATRDFVLRHVFEVAPELLKSPADLLRMLLRRHYRGRSFPPSLDAHLIQLLRQSVRWADWPLDQIVPSRAAFLEFLQERWPTFVRSRIASKEAGRVSTPPVAYALRYDGPVDLPLDHDDVRVYIDSLFIEGHLTPTLAVPKASVAGTWMAVGVAGDELTDRVDRLTRLMAHIADEFPSPAADHRAWLTTAQSWAEVVALRWSLPASAVGASATQHDALHDRIERAFHEWLDARYSTLASLTPWPRPIMLHHVPHFLSHGMNHAAAATRSALIVVDGLALDQWVVARGALPKNCLSIDEGAVFAWIPTLTCVSRQAIFVGEPPFFFAASIGTTQKEEQHWARYWESRGIRRADVAYLCQGSMESDDALVERVREKADRTSCRMLAVVVGTVDQMLHGAVTGTDGLHASVRHWAERGALLRLLEHLVGAGFEVFLTADHGNVQGTGIGKPNVGVTAEERGERVHVFRDQIARQGVASNYAGSIEWPTDGLPDDYLALVAPARRAFVAEGKPIVAHGGICIEEVVVPFVRITRSA